MKNISIWKSTTDDINFPSLNSDKETDVLIIGGGITGASIFYHLKNSNLKVMLVEQNKIGFSTTGNSTGKLSFLQNDLIDKIRKNFNDSKASLYLKSQIDAINKTIDIIKKEAIDCDLESVKSKLYTNKKSEIKKLKDLEKFLKENGINVNETTNNLVKSKYMIEVNDTYMFHPIKFVQGLLKDEKNIYEQTSIQKCVRDDEGYISYTNNNKIRCKYVVIASHYPYFNLPFFFPIKASLEKSYLSASKYNGEDISLISYSTPFISIRTYKDYLIYLSNSHLNNNDTNDLKNFEELKKKLKDLKLKPNYLWSNIDVMTSDCLPYIGRLKDNIFLATGYNTWGLANSVLAGSIIRDIILNNENEYIELFNPKRHNMSKLMGGFTSAYDSMTGYMNGFTKGDLKCPHMGCKLIYNQLEQSWDCPCHGSRFDKNGKVISAPAKENIDLS